ncbi:hypothetical protein V1460_35465 [Streptomyces sp. SCSIO 30461]
MCGHRAAGFQVPADGTESARGGKSVPEAAHDGVGSDRRLTIEHAAP